MSLQIIGFYAIPYDLGRLAVRFLFETSGVLGVQPELEVQSFTARVARNDYEVLFRSTITLSP